MKKTMVISLLVLFSIASVWAQTIIQKQDDQVMMRLRKITVDSPNGGEVWDVGQAYQVSWTEKGIIGDVKHILIGYPSGKEWTLGTVKADKKHLKFYYQILSDFAGYDQYKVRVTTLDGKVKDESDEPFKIRSRQLIKPVRHLSRKKMELKKPYIRIVYPPDGFVFKLPHKIKIKVELSSKSVVLFHISKHGHSGIFKVRKIQESELRKTRDGKYIGLLKIDLKSGKYVVTAAPQTNLDLFRNVNAAGPVNFSVTPPSISLEKK